MEPAQKTREQQERDILARRYSQNPRACGPGYGGTFTVTFKTFNNSSEPLFWTGSGFKDTSIVRGPPVEFTSREAAENLIRTELLGFIQKWRADQTHLIIGWETK